MKKLKNYINGKWTESKSNKYLNVRNTRNGEIIKHVPEGCIEDVNLAASAAAEAFLKWRNTPAEKESSIYLK